MPLLDTNILSEIVRRYPDPKVLGRFEAVPDEDLLPDSLRRLRKSLNTNSLRDPHRTLTGHSPS